MHAAKESLRRKIGSKLKAHKADEIRKKSLKIQKKLFGLEEFKKAETLCFYAAMAGEVNTLPMISKAIKQGKRVFLPACDSKNTRLKFYKVTSLKDLRKGSFGIPEPCVMKGKEADLKKIDCVIVPGLAFDASGNRLGRGKGYYDKFLSCLSKRVVKIGIGFSFQVVKEIPMQEHDRRLDIILTD